MRALRTATAVFLSAVLLTACAKAPALEGTEAPTQGGMTTIRVLTWSSLMDPLILAYNAKYPNERIQPVPVATPDAMTERLERGEADVASIVFPKMVQADLLLPLDPLIQESQLDLKPYGATLDSLRYDGKLYELPYRVLPTVLLYNKDLFDAAGLQPPKAGWTWDDLRVAAQKMTRGEGKDRVWGFDPGFAQGLAMLYLSQSPTPPPARYEDLAFMKETFQYFGTLVQTDRSVATTKELDRQENGPGTRPSFHNGRMGIYLQNPEVLPGLEAYFERTGRRFSYDIAPTPVRPGGKMAAQATLYSFGIAANSPNADAAWRFVSFAAGPEGAAALARNGTLPLYNSPDVKKAWFERQPAPSPGSAFLFETTWNVQRAPRTTVSYVGTPELVMNLFDNITAIFDGEKGWEEAFADYQVALKQWQVANEGG